MEELNDYLESRGSEIAPKAYLLNDLKLVDYPNLITRSDIVNAIRSELVTSEKAAVLIEL